MEITQFHRGMFPSVTFHRNINKSFQQFVTLESLHPQIWNWQVEARIWWMVCSKHDACSLVHTVLLSRSAQW